jgi:hypothetical protein
MDYLGTYGNVDFLRQVGSSAVSQVASIAISPIDGKIFAVGRSGSGADFCIRSSSAGAVGTFGTVFAGPTGYEITASPIDGAVYVCGRDSLAVWTTLRSATRRNTEHLLR